MLATTASKDIGIISPYSAQCRKIRALLGRMSVPMEDLKVGTTEEFQGQVSIRVSD